MPKFSITVLLLLCFLAPGAKVASQEFPMLHYTQDDGLPGNTVYEIYRDSKGFLWLATDKGIARYNGIRFESFTTFDGLTDNVVFLFQEDKYGRLWMGTYNGKLCYYKDGVFHNPANTPFLNLPFIASFIRNISLQNDSSIIFRFSDPTKFLVIKDEKTRIMDLDPLNDKQKEFGLVYREKESENRYKLIFSDKILVIDTLCHIISREALSDSFYNGKSKFASCQDQFYMYNNRLVFNTKMNIVRRFPKNFTEKNYLYQVYLDKANCFYTTNNGIFINDSTQILKGVNVSSITQDLNGDYWISTLDNGIYTVNSQILNNKLYNYHYENKVRYAHTAGNNLFFTNSDNNLFQLKNDSIRCIFNFKKLNSIPQGYAGNMGYVIDENGSYINYYGNNMIFIDNLLSDRLKITQVSGWEGEFKSVIKLNNYLYMLKILQIYRTEKSIPDVIAYKQTNLVRAAANNERIFRVARSPENELWYSTIKAMYKMMGDSGIIQPQFGTLAFKTFDFFGKNMVGITHDNKLVICSDVNTKIRMDSIPQQNCIWEQFIQLDSSNILITTNNLYRILTLYPGASAQHYHISAIENPYIPVNAEAICADSGNCYFFKSGSITTIDIKSLLARAQPPQLFFRTLKTAQRSYAIDSELLIPFSESKNMTISFSALSFSGKDLSVQYALSKNEEDNWREVRGGELNLVHPGYGVYTIKIRARTISSAYSQPVLFTLRISRPIWATWWFITVGSLALAAFLIWVFRYRVKVILRKQEKEHENRIKFMRLEYKALNALMNPHFIFNTLNNVQSLINKNEKLAANKYLGIFASLIRQNMQNISRELIPLQKEMDIVANYLELEKLRFKDLLNYEIHIGDDVELSDVLIPPLLIQPLVENSIKHGILPRKSTDSLIRIEIAQRKEFLEISVKDNGIGIEAARETSGNLHESYGLENIRKRIEQMAIMQNKQISLHITDERDASGGLKWTIVSIKIGI